MLPVSPAFFLSFPTGIWTLRWLGKTAELDERPMSLGLAGNGESRSWGATTMLYIRENRWTRGVAIANFAALGLVILALSARSLGYYPVKLTYRVVNPRTEKYLLTESLESRLDGFIS